MEIVEHENEFHIHIPFDKWHKRNTQIVKSLPERHWDRKKQIWRVPHYAKPAVYELRGTHKANIRQAGQLQSVTYTDLPPMPELEINIPVNGTLRHYQGQGVAQNIAFGSSLNGDEPGLGKTIQSIATIIALDAFPCLVICPAPLKRNWRTEWHKFTNKKALIIDDKCRNTWHQYYNVGMVDVFIVNYESLSKYFVDCLPQKGGTTRSGNKMHSREIELRKTAHLFSSVIVDESHRCKNEDTLTSKLTLRLTHKKKHVFALSGTPILNKPADIWPQLAIINKLHHFGGREVFLERYCEGGRGANNLKELNYLLRKHCFFRREKRDVLSDLPEKQRQMISCDITNRKEYDIARNEFVQYLRAKGCSDSEVKRKLKGEIMVKMQILRQISAKGKLREVKSWTEDILEAGEKVVLFCNLHSIVDSLKEMFPSAVSITGRDSEEQKQASVDKFQNDPTCQVIICNIKAGGVGHTLTASWRVGFVEFPYHPGDCIQCEDRTHRFGQVNKVMATYFLGENTIDEDFYQFILDKMVIVNGVTGSNENMEMEIVSTIIDKLNF